MAAKAPKMQLVPFIRTVILNNKSREYQFREIEYCLQVSRGQAKVLFFAWMFRASESFLQEKLEEFKIKVVK